MFLDRLSRFCKPRLPIMTDGDQPGVVLADSVGSNTANEVTAYPSGVVMPLEARGRRPRRNHPVKYSKHHKLVWYMYVLKCVVVQAA
jgi:hypothetical protein